MDDISSGNTLKPINEFRDAILDCTKNIKSNDNTFGTTVLPKVSNKLSDFMSHYVDAYHQIETTQRTVSKLHSHVMDDERDPLGGDPVDLKAFGELYKKTYDTESKEASGATEYFDELQGMLSIRRQQPVTQDEDVVVEPTVNREIPKDPITKMNIKIAVRSKKCNHLYDQTTINSYIEQRGKDRSTVKCPVAGCNNKDLKKYGFILDAETNDLIASLT